MKKGRRDGGNREKEGDMGQTYIGKSVGVFQLKRACTSLFSVLFYSSICVRNRGRASLT